MRDGWRVLMRAPGVILAEIIWRWTFGATAFVLLFVSFREYFSSIEISQTEYQLMKSLEPFTWIAISVRVMQAVVSGIERMGPILIPALAILWIALASVGRVGTVRPLLDQDGKTNWRAVILIHAFRVLLAVASLLAFFGAGAIISETFDPEQVGVNFVLMTLVLVVLTAIGSVGNWFLSAAALFSSKDGAGLKASFASANDLYYTRGIAGVGILFALMRTAMVIGVSFVSLFAFGALAQGYRRGPLLLIVLFTLGYFAISDALYVWRLAVYIGLTEPEREVPAEAGMGFVPPVVPGEWIPEQERSEPLSSPPAPPVSPPEVEGHEPIDESQAPLIH